MKIGDLVRYLGDANTALAPGIILRVYEHPDFPQSMEGSKWRKMASIHWFRSLRPSQEFAQELLEVVSESI